MNLMKKIFFLGCAILSSLTGTAFTAEHGAVQRPRGALFNMFHTHSLEPVLVPKGHKIPVEVLVKTQDWVTSEELMIADFDRPTCYITTLRPFQFRLKDGSTVDYSLHQLAQLIDYPDALQELFEDMSHDQIQQICSLGLWITSSLQHNRYRGRGRAVCPTNSKYHLIQLDEIKGNDNGRLHVEGCPRYEFPVNFSSSCAGLFPDDCTSPDFYKRNPDAWHFLADKCARRYDTFTQRGQPFAITPYFVRCINDEYVIRDGIQHLSQPTTPQEVTTLNLLRDCLNHAYGSPKTVIVTGQAPQLVDFTDLTKKVEVHHEELLLSGVPLPLNEVFGKDKIWLLLLRPESNKNTLPYIMDGRLPPHPKTPAVFATDLAWLQD